ERLEVHAINGDAGLDVVGSPAESDEGAVRVAVEPVVGELVGRDVDDAWRMQRTSPRTSLAAHFEEVGEVGLVAKDERHGERPRGVVRELDALDHVVVDELASPQV